ncbi:MAG: GTP-binding protein [Eubacteriales bacterium]|nr:GTP-binding protein [Eubacteriales bacterium]
MTKIDIFSGFLGAGKTTLIKKLIKEAYTGEKLVLIENEFGQIGIDGGFMQDAGIEVREMNSGCICCSLVGDFGKALEKVLVEYQPDRILIEPSGVGKLSDIIRAVQNVAPQGAVLNGFTTVVDVGKCKMYMKNFGEFFNDQVENAGCIVLSHSGGVSEQKINEAVELLRGHNATAVIVTTPWEQLDGRQLLEAMERRDTIEDELARLAASAGDAHPHHHHHHDDDDECDDPECSCHHHDDDDEEDGHGHHHHHHHHHDHDADEVFVSWGVETTKKFGEDELRDILESLLEEGKYGVVLRAKGIVEGTDGRWIHFDYVPGESDVRHGSAGVTGRLCVIGSHLNRAALAGLFGVERKKQ